MNHLAIIMDGNSRWAERKGLTTFAGHEAGTKATKKAVEYALNKQIKHLSLFAFSTENWLRPKKEVDYLIYLLEKYLDEEKANLAEKEIQLSVIGSLSKLPGILQKKINSINNTKISSPKLNLYINFSYGGRQEIVDATKNCIIARIDPDKLTTENFNEFLYAPEMPNIDLVIRTGDRKRISNFLLWHISYAEIYFSSKYWPEFSEQDFNQAIEDYYGQIRTFGMR